MIRRVLFWPWIAYRLQRFEIAFWFASATLAMIAILGLGARLNGLHAMNPGCVADASTSISGCAAIAEESQTWAALADAVGAAIMVLPLVAGVVLGAPIVGREVERGTSLLSWPLAASRLRWIFLRGWPVVVILVVPALLLGGGMEALAHAVLPTAELSEDFRWLDRRGPVIAMRPVFAFGVGFIAGAAAGRVVPALLSGVGVSLLVTLAVGFGLAAYGRSEAIPSAWNVIDPAALDVGGMVRSQDGKLMTFEEADRGGIVPVGDLESPEVDPETLPPGYSLGEAVVMTVPSENAPVWYARALATYALLASTCLAGGLVIAGRRRAL